MTLGDVQNCLPPHFSTFSITQGVPLCSCGSEHVPLLLSQMWVSCGSYLSLWPWDRCTHSMIYAVVTTHKALTGQLCIPRDHYCKTNLMTLHTPHQILLSIGHLLKCFNKVLLSLFEWFSLLRPSLEKLYFRQPKASEEERCLPKSIHYIAWAC